MITALTAHGDAIALPTSIAGVGFPARRRVAHRCAGGPAMPALKTSISCHTFRATGLGYYLINGGRIEVGRHSNAKPPASMTWGSRAERDLTSATSPPVC